ncbi:hypothetical protein HDU76_011166 [Blyttiomyces sp. JEL0837]|nr:hypothetical protein HDU76_011166 [Blyttiomyces sp. JEL0837]
MTAPECQTLSVLYASQTGNAEWIAKHIHEEAIARGFTSCVFTLDEHEKANFAGDNAIIFVVSTTGDGDPPDNATKFWRWLRRAKKPELDALKGKKYAILGLGDTNYTNFCQTAKRLDRKLAELGAEPFLAKGMADDGTGLEQVVDPWIESLWKILPTIIHHDAEKAAAYASAAESRARAGAFLSSKKKEKDGGESTTTTTTKSTDYKKEKTNGATPMDTDIVATTATNGTTNSVSTPMEIESTTTTTTPSYNYNIPEIPIHYKPSSIPLKFDTVPTNPDDVTNPTSLSPSYLTITPTTNRRTIETSKNSLFHLYDYTNVSTEPFQYTLNKPYNKAKITNARYLTGSRALKRVLELDVEFGEGEDGLNWDVGAGDVLGIVAPNEDFVVLPLLKRLGVADPEVVVGVKGLEGDGGSSGGTGLPFTTDHPYTIYEAFKYLLDLRSPPRKPLLRLLADHATNPLEKARLLYLTTSSGSKDFRFLKESHAGLPDLLETFPSVENINLERLFELLPRLQGRFYSVALMRRGSQAVDGKLKTKGVTVAFNVEEFVNSVTGAPRVGHCTYYLENLVRGLISNGNGDIVMNGSLEIALPIFPRPVNHFKPPKSLATSMILVCAGTGITPFLSFLQEREELIQHARLSNANQDLKVGQVWLIHGRRFAELNDGDRVYGNEIDGYVKNGVLNRFVEVLSREDGRLGSLEGLNLVGEVVVVKYVQDAVRALGKEVWKVVEEEGGSVYVCGGVNMARDVHTALTDVTTNVGGIAEAVEVKKFWAKMTEEKRYQRDIWS